jgi:hypothetical protein
MRLDFSNIGRGLVAIADAKKARDLARESARYDVTEGAYGAELEQNIQQLEGLKAQDPAQAPAYDQAITELRRRVGLTAPDFTVASRAVRPEDTFGTREEATRAARPMRAEGLAGVYRGFGDVEKADELMERADAARLRDIQFEDAQLGLKGRRRTEAEAEGMQMAQQLLTGAEQAGQPITSEFLRVVSSQTGANYNALVDSAAKAIGFQEASATAALNKLKRDFAKAAGGGPEGLNTFLAENFDPDGTDELKPEVTRDARGNFIVTYGGRVLPQYGTNRSIEELVARTQGFIDADPLGAIKNILDIDLRRAEIGLRGAQADYYGRERPDRKPTEADVTSRARYLLDNDRTGQLTPDQALTQARQSLGVGGGAAPAPTGIELLIQRMDEQRRLEQAARENPQAGLR